MLGDPVRRLPCEERHRDEAPQGVCNNGGRLPVVIGHCLLNEPGQVAEKADLGHT
jgi:hypothetical protein